MVRLRQRTRWQIAIRYCGLTPTVRAIAWALSTWMRPDGEGCRPTVEDVAAAVGVKRDTVFRALATLKRRGLLVVQGGGGRHRASTYVPAIPPELEAWIETVLEGNGRTGATVSGSERSHRITQTVAPGESNGRTGATPALGAIGASIDEDEDPRTIPPDVEAVAGVAVGEAFRMLQDRRRGEAAG